MADKKQQGVSAGVMGSQDGWAYVNKLETDNTNQYLQTYGARLEGYKIQPGENYTNVVMKLSFPMATDRNNVNLWTFFIAQSMHKIGKKPFITVENASEGFVGYCSFNIWNNVKYMESKSAGRNSW